MGRLVRYNVGVALLLVLTACTSGFFGNAKDSPAPEVSEPVEAKVKPKVAEQANESDAMNAYLAEADLAYRSNQADKATKVLNEAISKYPANKMPWLRIAQTRFDMGIYSEAIENALEALIRDPKDKVAHSIVVVSGLRLATQSLSELRNQNEISGPLKTEAEDLAAIIRESLGEPELVNSPVFVQEPAIPPTEAVQSVSRTKSKKPKPNTPSKKLPSQAPVVKPLPASKSVTGNPFDVLR